MLDLQDYLLAHSVMLLVIPKMFTRARSHQFTPVPSNEEGDFSITDSLPERSHRTDTRWKTTSFLLAILGASAVGAIAGYWGGRVRSSSDVYVEGLLGNR